MAEGINMETKELNKKWIYGISFVLPILLVIIAQSLNSMSFWGTKTFLAADLKSQYISFHYLLHDLIYGKANWGFTFQGGMGVGTLGIIGYYLMSPFAFIIALFPKDLLVYLIQIVYWIKVGLAGLFMAIYLKNTFKKMTWWTIPLAISYALSGFIVVYQSNIMWLDVVYIFPIIMLGVDKLIQDGKSGIFIFGITYALVTNFYIGYMACIGAFLYFLVRIFELGEKPISFWKKFFHFVSSGIISALLAAPIVVPVVLETLSAPKKDQAIQWFKFDLTEPINTLSKFLTGVQYPLVDVNQNAPNVYVGLFILLLAVLFFLNRTILLKTKLLWLAALIVLFIATQSVGMNYVFHGFAEPNGWPYRYIFIFSAFAVVMAAKSIDVFSGLKMYQILIVLSALLLLFVLLYLNNGEIISRKILVINAAMLICLTIGLIGLEKYQKIAISCLVLLVAADLLMNTYQTNRVYPAETYEQYNQFDKEKTAIVSEVGGSDFSRMDFTSQQPFRNNDSFRYGLNGITNYNTLTHKQLNQNLGKLGFLTTPSMVWLRYEGNTLITDSLFGVAYNIQPKNSQITKEGFKRVMQTASYDVYQNQNALSLAYIPQVDYQAVSSKLDDPSLNYFEKQNLLFSKKGSELPYFQMTTPVKWEAKDLTVTRNNNVLTLQKNQHVTEGKLEAQIEIQKPSQLYLSLNGIVNSATPLQIYVNGKQVSHSTFEVAPHIINLGEQKSGVTTVTFVVRNAVENIGGLQFAKLDLEMFRNRVNALEKSNVHVEKIREDQLEINFVAEEKETVQFTIPYSKGWSAKVNGEKTEITPLYNKSFIGVEVPKGKNKIELSYRQPGLFAGFLALLVGSALLIWLRFRAKRS